MTENPNDPLTPVELFRRGREPAQPLSEVFDPMRGPILKYFIETIRIINRTQFIERFCRTDALKV